MLPREKFRFWGVASLSLTELVAIILSSGTKANNVFSISKKVSNFLKQGGSELDKLSGITGVGEVKAMKLLAALELGVRIAYRESPLIVISSSQKAYETLKGIGVYKQEHLVGVFLNARYELMGKKTVSIGTVDSVQVLPRDIIISALKFNASYVIMAHNHPSGSLVPSKEDILVTKRTKQALDLVGISLLDHLVIGREGWKSVPLSD